MSYTITEPVHITMTVDGEDVSLDLAPGDVELSAPIADLLVAQGVATEATSKSTKKTTTPTEG